MKHIPLLRAAAAGLVLAGGFAFCGSPASELVVASNGTNSIPVDDPGWNNVSIAAATPGAWGRNYIYLGDGWALTARHVGPSDTNNQFLSFPTGTYKVIPNQNTTFNNPSQVKNQFGAMINPSSLVQSTETDLRLVRLDVSGGGSLPPSICASSASCIISGTSPPTGAEMMFIGHGPAKTGSLTGWTSSWVPVAPGMGSYTGYATDGIDTKAWGKNQLASPSSYPSYIPSYQILSSTTGIVNANFPDNVTRATISLLSSYDASGLTDEAQAVSHDSGTAVFYKRNNTWELSGIVNLVIPVDNNQPNDVAAYGDVTTFADLSYYRSTILAYIDNHKGYSMNGDLNLDGIVSGNGTGPAATDDLSAFISGWGTTQMKGDINSWKRGDLNLDGKVDAADFLLLRNAYNGVPGGGAALNSIIDRVGGGTTGGVPEPSTIVLAAMGAGLVGCISRRRRVG